MDIVTIDFETYYDKDYSLSKMTTEAYIRDPRFQVIMVGVKINNHETDVFSGAEVGTFLRSMSYKQAAILCHNTAFDGAILSWHYGIKPALWLDTLSMARPGHSVIAGGSLAKLVKHYKLGEKGTEVINALGKRLEDFTTQELKAYAEYCALDVDLTYKLFRKLSKGFPQSELQIIDLVLRMYTEPMIELDSDVLTAHLADVEASKQALMDRIAGGDEEKFRKVMMSNPMFARLLTLLGVDPPMKTSKTTGGLTYAFSKTDEEFLALQEHPDSKVQAVVNARLGVKSTLEETRTNSMLEVAARGRLPVMLNYYGAHCVPGDTEVLTPDGWERLDVWGGGKVAQWHPESGAVEFLSASQYVGPVVDKWVVSTAPYIPIEMTLGHTVPTLAHRTRRLVPEAAGNLISRGSFYVPTSGKFVCEHRFTPEQTRVLVMIQADGSFETNSRRGRRLTIFLKKPRKIERARKLLTEAGVEFETQAYPSWPGYVRFIVRSRCYPEWLSAEQKVFGPWVFGCHLDVLLDEIKHWDGWVQGGQVCYSTSEFANAEWVQTVAHLANMGCAMTIRKGSGNRRDNFVLRLRNRTECMVKRGQLTLVDRQQLAYCVESQTGYWLARANGHIFVTGNTGRFSGGDKLNLQNLPKRGGKLALREAMCAPIGYKFVGCDSAQIEARILAWMAGQDELVSAFANKRDVYSEFASTVFGRTVTKEDKTERHVGKTAILGLGYGMGAERFKSSLKLGKPSVDMELDEAKRVVNVYRNNNFMITGLWRRCDDMLKTMLAGGEGAIHNAVTYDRDGLILPNGMRITYHGLSASNNGFSYFNDARQYAKYLRGEEAKTTHIYGGKITENIVQALAALIIREQMLAAHKAGLKVVLQVHDEIVVVIPEAEVAAAEAKLIEIMSTPPVWARGLPLACESGISANYGGV